MSQLADNKPEKFIRAILIPEKEMSRLVDNDPVMMKAYAEFVRLHSDPVMQDYLRRRTLAEFDRSMELKDAHESGILEGSIVRTLSHRFGTVPKSLEAKLHSLTDLETLGNLLDRALDCPTLQDFEQIIN